MIMRTLTGVEEKEEILIYMSFSDGSGYKNNKIKNLTSFQIGR